MKDLHCKLASGAAAAALVLLLSAAQRPTALAQTSPGLWEISGMPGEAAPARRCLIDTAALAQVEHRGQSCTRVIVSDAPSTAVIHYTCTNGGFGRTQMTVLTPRSIRVETQGISNGAPFNYTVNARRVGACPAH
jgi:hypothetical protein